MYNLVIVEDEDLEREALRKILTENFDCIRIVGEARTGAEAVALIDSCDVDLMLVDINIPIITGLDVIRHLREGHVDTKVVVTTAYDYFEMTREAIHLKVDEYLLKPVRTQALVSTLETCIQQLGADRKCRVMVARLGELADQNAYQDGVALVRRHVEWICTQRDYPCRDVAQNSATALLALIRAKGLRVSAALARQVTELRTMSLDDRGLQSVLGVFLGLADLLFDVREEQLDEAGSTVQKAINYIERNLSKRVTLEDAADYAKISACYLSRMFKKTLDVNFVTYLTTRRMELAKELLAGTERSITNIAKEFSYNDLNYFCKSFKKEIGVSPSEYRRQAREGQGGAPGVRMATMAEPRP
ncbi:response regulator transcription factor [Rhodopseudomonas palustris]|uniref:Two component transcriptional regulator, AraC family n=1 Tax=Rhodopseudomonas palustris (strain BisB18) TaxID=316056 RepID=Q21A44_RHOPB